VANPGLQRSSFFLSSGSSVIRRAIEPPISRFRHAAGSQTAATRLALVSNANTAFVGRSCRADQRRSFRGWRWSVVLVPGLLGACAVDGDFGRIKPELVADDTHAWLGTEAVYRYGGPFSVFPLTDEERLLRDLGYPLIEAPYDRQRWYSIVNEYGVRRFFQREWLTFTLDAYERQLMATAYRSANARYSKLNEDIRNDVVRMGPFFGVARHVLDMDDKRGKSLSHIGGLPPREQNNAIARIAENALIIAWVQCSLGQRAASYRYTLEHLVISTPTPVAVDVERSLTLMQTNIANKHLLDEPNICGEGVGPISLAPLAVGPGSVAPLAAAPPTIVSK
jgi:hypothetical protein